MGIPDCPKLCWDKPKILPWLILSMAAMSVIFLGGKRRAFGGFVAALQAEFNSTSLTELNAIGDSYSALGYICTTLASPLILACGRSYAFFQFMGSMCVLASCIFSAFVPSPTWLFLTHTVVHGIGSALILSAVGLVVNEHFGKEHPYRILATTLVSGGSVASVIFIQIYAATIQYAGWRNAFIILGIVYFVVLSVPCLFFRRNEEMENYFEKKCAFDSDKLHRHHIPLIILWTIDRIMTSTVTYGLLMNLTHFLYRGHTHALTQSTTLTMLFAGGEAMTYLVGAITTGLTKDLFRYRLKYILLISSLLFSLFLFLWEFSTKIFPLSCIFSFLCGICLGPSITFLFPAGEEITTLPGHMAYPYSLAGMGIGMAISPSMTGKVAEALNFNWFFAVLGSFIFLKSMCLLSCTILIHVWRLEPLSSVGEYVNLDELKAEETKKEPIGESDSVSTNK